MWSNLRMSFLKFYYAMVIRIVLCHGGKDMDHPFGFSVLSWVGYKTNTKKLANIYAI